MVDNAEKLVLLSRALFQQRQPEGPEHVALFLACVYTRMGRPLPFLVDHGGEWGGHRNRLRGLLARANRRRTKSVFETNPASMQLRDFLKALAYRPFAQLLPKKVRAGIVYSIVQETQQAAAAETQRHLQDEENKEKSVFELASDYLDSAFRGADEERPEHPDSIMNSLELSESLPLTLEGLDAVHASIKDVDLLMEEEDGLALLEDYLKAIEEGTAPAIDPEQGDQCLVEAYDLRPRKQPLFGQF